MALSARGTVQGEGAPAGAWLGRGKVRGYSEGCPSQVAGSSGGSEFFRKGLSTGKAAEHLEAGGLPVIG